MVGPRPEREAQPLRRETFPIGLEEVWDMRTDKITAMTDSAVESMAHPTVPETNENQMTLVMTLVLRSERCSTLAG